MYILFVRPSSFIERWQLNTRHLDAPLLGVPRSLVMDINTHAGNGKKRAPSPISRQPTGSHTRDFLLQLSVRPGDTFLFFPSTMTLLQSICSSAIGPMILSLYGGLVMAAIK